MPDKESYQQGREIPATLPILFAINRIDLLNNDRERGKGTQKRSFHFALQATYGQDGIFLYFSPERPGRPRGGRFESWGNPGCRIWRTKNCPRF